MSAESHKKFLEKRALQAAQKAIDRHGGTSRARVTGRIRSHFEAHRKRKKWPFLVRTTLEGIAVSLFCVVLLAGFTEGGRPDLERLSPLKLIVLTVLVAPILETFLLQTIPVAIARAFGVHFWVQVLASLVPFAGLHFTNGIGSGVGAGVVGGFYLAFTYVRWREESFGTAFMVTAGSHALRNCLAVALILSAKTILPPDKPPNKALEPTPGSVTPRAIERGSK